MSKHTPPAWAGLISEWEVSLYAAGRSVETVRMRTDWIKRLARAMEPAGPGEVTSAMFAKYSGRATWSVNTRKSVHDSARLFYTWAFQTGRVSEAPVIPGIRKGPAAPHPADDFSYQKGLHSTDRRVWLVVRLAAEAGLRRGEVARVNTSDLIADLTGRSLIVHGKGGKQRVVPISDDLAGAVEDAGPGYVFPGRDSGHLSPAWVGKLVGRAMPAGVTMHALRHRFASRAYAASSNLVAVQKLLGHASPDTTIQYIAVPASELRAAALGAA